MAVCFCGRSAIIRTSWTDQNPGRRFYAYPVTNSKCRFVGWVDPPMCPRAMEIIPGLLKSKNKLECQVKGLEAEIRLKKTLIHFLVIGLGFLFAVIAFGQLM